MSHREAAEETVVVSERYENPTDKYPHGSYLKTIGDTVVCRTGRFAEGKPIEDCGNFAFYGDKPPFVFLDPQVERLRNSRFPWEDENL